MTDAPTEPIVAGDGLSDSSPAAPAAAIAWRKDKRGREYVPAVGRSGQVTRQGEESVEDALARDAKGGKDVPPKRAKATVGTGKKPPAPTSIDLKELELALAEGLAAPSFVAAMRGDEWLANHFTQQGPELARNLVAASRHNPWLRRKLEEAVNGEDMMVKVVLMVGVGGALVAYAAPPIIYVLNLPVPPKAREMYAIPPRRESSRGRPPVAEAASAAAVAQAA